MKELIEKLEKIGEVLNNSTEFTLDSGKFELLNIADFDKICNYLTEVIQTLQQRESDKDSYVEWLERKVEQTLEDKDLQREHWAFCQSLKKYREISLPTPPNK